MTTVTMELPKDDDARVSFVTDVKNNYFNRTKDAGKVKFVGQFQPTFHLFNGRLTFTFNAPKKAVIGTTFMTQIEVSDDAGHGPFKLVVNAKIVPARPMVTHQPPKDKAQTQDSPSRPDVIEVHYGPEVQPLTIQKVPDSHRLQIAINKDSKLLERAKGAEVEGGDSGRRVRIQVRLGSHRHGLARICEADRTVEDRRGSVPEEYREPLHGRRAGYRPTLFDASAETAEGGLTLAFRWNSTTSWLPGVSPWSRARTKTASPSSDSRRRSRGPRTTAAKFR
jgi:hypothetical protein